jgi:biopolymer transport protein TolR
MLARGRPRRRPMSEINVVPYIDVMLVLLVIFMVTAPLLYHGIDVDLPELAAEPVEPSELDTIMVTVTSDGVFLLSIGVDPEQVVDAEQLLSRVAAQLANSPRSPVVVRGDRAVAYGEVLEVVASLRRAGVERVGLLTRPTQE